MSDNIHNVVLHYKVWYMPENYVAFTFTGVGMYVVSNLFWTTNFWGS